MKGFNISLASYIKAPEVSKAKYLEYYTYKQITHWTHYLITLQKHGKEDQFLKKLQ